ncbi:hypothetical protein V6N13_047947 [Hibiscus sabdariffa]|uniref:UspA domain-containing protein n=1 Tax=Hibiscus sabdariffa TaxID=183260 RepID=A0ABR2F5R2_9ROSI
MPCSAPFLRQLIGKQGWKSKSCRWGVNNKDSNDDIAGGNNSVGFETQTTLKTHLMSEGLKMYGNGDDDDAGGLVLRKRVMVVVDQSSHSKHAMMWALSHVANKGDLLTLLHVIPPAPKPSHSSSSSCLASSLESLCKACKPQVEVETVCVQGPKLWTVMSQVKKLGVSVLVLGQKRQSPLLTWCLSRRSENEEFVEQCIRKIDGNCLTIGVRKQSNGVGGYLITTRWLNNFWLLA